MNVYLNTDNVEKITIDALIYLLAIIKNMRKENVRPHNPIFASVPKNEDVLISFNKIGFFKSSSKKAEKKYFPIFKTFDSAKFDQKISRKLCEFVHKNSELNINDTNYLYETLCEMMLNSYQHAYNNENKLMHKFYVYSECYDKEIVFVFFDTGEGIPGTIERRNKRITKEKDDDLLLSAMNGDFRTSTKLQTRGSGLVSIKNSVAEDKITYLSITTNKASLSFTLDEKNQIKIEKNLLSGSLMGTLYYWKIRKEK